MTGWRFILALSAVSVVVLFVSEALAAPAQRALTELIEVHPGASCVDVETLATEVGAWLGTDTADADVWVRVDGSADDPRTVFFEVRRGDRLLARRRFAPGPERCENLQAVLGLTIALALRASLFDEIVGPREPPEGPAAPRDLWALGGGALVGLGVLPGTALGAAVRVERALPPNFALRVGAMGLITWDNSFATVPGSFDAETLALRVDACVRFDLATRLAARACAGILAGGIFAQGRDFASSRSAAWPWVAAANALELRLAPIDRWSLDAEATLVLPFGSTTVGVLSPAGDVAEARDLASVGVTLSVGPAYRF